MPLISPREVEAAFKDCFFTEEEDVDTMEKAEAAGAVCVVGVMGSYVFHPERLEALRPKVTAWLADLPATFHRSTGGGMSLLAACNDREEQLWTGYQVRMCELVELGIGLGLAAFCFPRPFWAALPGGMPYVQVNLEPKEEKYCEIAARRLAQEVLPL